jgi:hypothetical protein
MYKLTMSERTTTIVSALVALAILGLGVTAQPSGDPTSGRIEALESDLRFQIAMSWRHDGRTRDARDAQLTETLVAWKASPQTPADRQLLEKWLRGAIVGTLPGESGEFPPTPAFSEPAVATEKPKDAAIGPTIATKSGDKSPAPLPAVQPATTKNEIEAMPLPRDVRLKPGQAYTPPRAKEFRITPRLPSGRQPAANERQTAERNADPTPSTAAAPPKRVMAAKPVETPSTAGRMDTPPLAESKKKRTPSAIPTVPLESKPAMANASPGRLPAPSGAALGASAKPQAAEASSGAVEQEIDSTPVMVNLAELNAQIVGYHDGLDEIEGTVVAGRGRLTEGEVARLVGQLEQLAGQYQFVRLYYDGLTPRERRFVGAPRRMEETIALVEAERAALVAEDEDFLTALEEAAAEDELARRLKAVAAEVGAESLAEPQKEPRQ